VVPPLFCIVFLVENNAKQRVRYLLTSPHTPEITITLRRQL